MKKLLSKRGETMTEILVAILIMVLVFSLMSTSFVKAADINERIRAEDNGFQYSEEAVKTDATLTVEISATESLVIPVDCYEENEYYYYTIKPTE